MRILRIQKGTVRTAVDEALFLAEYKPKGWIEIDNTGKEVVEAEAVAVEQLDTTKPELQDEVKNINAMQKKKRQSNKFNDNLIKQ